MTYVSDEQLQEELKVWLSAHDMGPLQPIDGGVNAADILLQVLDSPDEDMGMDVDS